MSSAEVLEPTKPPAGQQTYKHASKTGGNNSNKRKNKYDRGNRKRSKSFSNCMNIINPKPVLPSKFLLGGNIKDPLNLNSLQDEEINRAMNAVTPKSSPVPTPPRKKGQLEIIIPKNIHDPLNLIDCEDDVTYEQQLNSPLKKKKKRFKKRRTMSATMDSDTPEVTLTSEAKTPENSTDSAKVPEEPSDSAPSSRDLSLDLGNKKLNLVKKFKENMDKIVSPVIPQPGAYFKRSNSMNKPKPRHSKFIKNGDLKMPQFKAKDKRFQYGNYNRYYGYRNVGQEDHRLKLFSRHSYLFKDKDILDIGCNIGHITLSVGRDFGAKSVIGIDIDTKLISIARKNVKYYVKTEQSPKQDEGGRFGGTNCTNDKSSEFFPISMPILYGALDIPGFNCSESRKRGFPDNVTFKQCNYIMEDDNLVNLEQPQFDVILCLSVTKWIHLNWGDAGLKQAFRRMYAQLRPGGKLVLEAQHWTSYKGKKKLTEVIYKNYNAIEFFPDKFREYLLSPAVGFAKSEILGCPQSQSKGFRRPILVFTKSTMFPSERVEATPSSITPTISNSADSDRTKTEKYEPKSQIPVHEHVYTDLYTRYCGCTDDNTTINDRIGEELNTDGIRCCLYGEGTGKVHFVHKGDKTENIKEDKSVGNDCKANSVVEITESNNTSDLTQLKTDKVRHEEKNEGVKIVQEMNCHNQNKT